MRHKTSVLISSSTNKSSKVRQVPTHIILNWKKYSFFSLVLVVILFIVSGFLIYQNTSCSYKARLEKANFIRNQIDINKALSAFSSIDSGMYRINLFLQERGLEKLKIENAGGVDYGFNIIHINDFADFYDNQLQEMEQTLKTIPLGKPHGGKISSGYGYRRNPFSGRGHEFHSGIDIRGQRGDTVRSTASGIITFAGYKGGYGNCIVVQHDKLLQTFYAHLSKINVEVGDCVESGQAIGRLGNTGRSTGPHLHYEVTFDNKKINPANYFNFE